MWPAAISRSATTVALSFSHSTVASAPLASLRARLAATRTSWNRFGTWCRQSSTVIRAMSEKPSDREKRVGQYTAEPAVPVPSALCTKSGADMKVRAAVFAGWVAVGLLGTVVDANADGDAKRGKVLAYTCHGCHGVPDYK